MRLLLEEGVQLLTLSGSPGVGKTELARQIEKIATTQKLFTSVHFISLEAVTSIPSVMQIIRKYCPSDKQTKVLLILDNCEQIEDIGKAASEISELLIQFSNFYILATSQAQFSAREHPVLPLSRPSTVYKPPEELETYDAIELFRQSAKRAGDKGKYPLTKENAQKIAALCIGLDGLPLAILIAASCAKHRTIDDVYAWYESSELYDKPYKDKPPRHQSLNSLFEYSYSLLNEQQQKLFQRLAVFNGICHRRAVVNICNLGDLPTNLDTILEELSDRHLIEYTDNYISIHNSLRKFAKARFKKGRKNLTV